VADVLVVEVVPRSAALTGDAWACAGTNDGLYNQLDPSERQNDGDREATGRKNLERSSSREFSYPIASTESVAGMKRLPHSPLGDGEFAWLERALNSIADLPHGRIFNQVLIPTNLAVRRATQDIVRLGLGPPCR
jgi:hypothetical protein